MSMISEKYDPTEDGSRVAYGIFFWQGMANLFPWNAYITAAGYFVIRFCGSTFADSFENFFSVAFMVSQTILLVLCVK